MLHIGSNTDISAAALIEEPEHIYVGDNVRIKGGVVLRPQEGFLCIGNNVVINEYSVLLGGGGIEIGDWSVLESHCVLCAQGRSLASFQKPLQLQMVPGKGITLMGDNWIGAGTTILDGVTLGKGTVINPGALVQDSFPMGKVVAGNPARIVESRSDDQTWNFAEAERCSIDKTPQEYWAYINRRKVFATRFIGPDDIVLDLGCGEGFISGAAAPLCKKVIGIDYSDEALECARSKYPDVEFYSGSCTHVDFPGESFTKVLCFEVIEHITLLQVKKMLNEVLRVLRPDGMFIGSTPLRTTAQSNPATYSHIYEYNESELRGLLQRFSDVSISERLYFSCSKTM